LNSPCGPPFNAGNVATELERIRRGLDRTGAELAGAAEVIKRLGSQAWMVVRWFGVAAMTLSLTGDSSSARDWCKIGGVDKIFEGLKAKMFAIRKTFPGKTHPITGNRLGQAPDTGKNVATAVWDINAVAVGDVFAISGRKDFDALFPNRLRYPTEPRFASRLDHPFGNRDHAEMKILEQFHLDFPPRIPGYIFLFTHFPPCNKTAIDCQLSIEDFRQTYGDYGRNIPSTFKLCVRDGKGKDW
jgi:hypothetical protein